MSDLVRFDVESHDQKPAICLEADKGYWTPWYIANRRIGELRQKRDELQARVAELESENDTLCDDIRDLLLNFEKEPWLLRQKAEAVQATADDFKHYENTGKARGILTYKAMMLRKAADEAEKES